MYGLFLRHFYLIKSSLPRVLDLIYWPTIQIILWGFISKFFSIHSEYYNNTIGVILTCAIHCTFKTQRNNYIINFHSINKNFNWISASSYSNFSIVWCLNIKIGIPFIIIIFKSLYFWDNSWIICECWPYEIWSIF